MAKYKLSISYDGTNYSGFQIQKKKITIQKAIEDSLKKILQEDIKIYASSRTDAKVHALNQVAHFSTNKKFILKKLIYSLNSILPSDIRINKLQKTKESFHARFSAKGKIYRYHINLNPIEDPFKKNYFYTPYEKIDLNLLKEAKKSFLGKHNFLSFANKQDKGSAKNSPIKTIKRIDIIKKKDLIILEFEADGFLYKMVRNIVGTLLAVATNKMPIDNIEKIIKAQDRKLAPAPAQAKGLFLIKVIY